MKIKIKKLSSVIPDLHYAKEGDAGFDLYTRERIVLAPGAIVKIPSGISYEIPEGYVGLIWDKGGVSMNRGLKTLGGVSDAGYRGEVMIGMVNLSDQEQIFEIGDRVAQMVIQKFEKVEFEITEELNDSERGATGFGSSGK